MLPARHRLRTSAQFSAVTRGRTVRRAASRLLVVHCRIDEAGRDADSPPRVGFVVSKALGGAVVRNRTKRRLRALMAAQVARLPSGSVVVVRANPAAAAVPFPELEADVDRLVHRTLAGREPATVTGTGRGRT